VQRNLAAVSCDEHVLGSAGTSAGIDGYALSAAVEQQGRIGAVAEPAQELAGIREAGQPAIGKTRAQFRVVHDGVKQALDGTGQGLIEALVDAVSKHFNVTVAVKDFDEHAMTPGTEAKAIASIMLEVDGETVTACCIDEDSSRATLQATLSAVGRSGVVRQRLRRAG